MKRSPEEILAQYEDRLIRALGQNYRDHAQYSAMLDEIRKGRSVQYVIADREEKPVHREKKRTGW